MQVNFGLRKPRHPLPYGPMARINRVVSQQRNQSHPPIARAMAIRKFALAHVCRISARKPLSVDGRSKIRCRFPMRHGPKCPTPAKIGKTSCPLGCVGKQAPLDCSSQAQDDGREAKAKGLCGRVRPKSERHCNGSVEAEALATHAPGACSANAKEPLLKLFRVLIWNRRPVVQSGMTGKTGNYWERAALNGVSSLLPVFAPEEPAGSKHGIGGPSHRLR